MDKYQAEKIINAYGGAIADDKHGLKKQSTLPCSKAKIRQAFFIYISAIINEFKNLPTEMGQNLVMTYSMLDCFVPDNEADRLNSIMDLMNDKKFDKDNEDHKKRFREYTNVFTTANLNGKDYDEINEFIGECYKENGINDN